MLFRSALAARLGVDAIAHIGEIPTVAHPIVFSATPAAYTRRPPTIGDTTIDEALS